MDSTIEMAKCTLADIFNIRKEEFDKHISRKKPVIEARRFLIYFLVDELGMKFSKVPQVMTSLTNHASIMHHFYKMMDLMELESHTRIKYVDFKNQILEKGLDKLEKELVKQMKMRKVISWNIKELERMIDEA